MPYLTHNDILDIVKIVCKAFVIGMTPAEISVTGRLDLLKKELDKL